MIKVGIISDTHNVLRDDVIYEMESCDYIIHAGDVCNKETLEKLLKLKNVVVVKGNNDCLDLDESKELKINGYSFYVVHQKGDRKDVDFYIYGHSHQYACYREEGVCYINPGSCGRRRFKLPLTYVILYLDEQGYRVEKRTCDD